MRTALLVMLLIAAPAAAVDRVELRIGRVDASGWQLRDVAADWHRDGRVRLQARAQGQALPHPLHAELDCARLRTDDGVHCGALRLRATLDGATLETTGAAHVATADRWQLTLHQGRLRLQHDSEDGRLAADKLQLGLSGDIDRRDGGTRLQVQAHSLGGQAYVEPWFVDLDTQPLAVEAALSLSGTDALQIGRLQLRLPGAAALTASGELRLSDWTRRHRLQVDVDIADTAPLVPYAQAALATTRLRGLQADGALRLAAMVDNRRLVQADATLDDLSVTAPDLAAGFDGLDGRIAWTDAGTARASRLAWRSGQIGRIPVGAAQWRFETAGRRFALREPVDVPLLDGSLAIERLALSGLGSDALQADFAARLRPIGLAGLCRALGWPEFAGTLSGSVPGLQLRDGRLFLDGALSASAFDGEIRVSDLRIIEPFGVLPRVAADVHLRRLDLAALTGAFDFGRITGRLDGDIDGLRLIGWEPVAMDAHLYSTPGDRSRKRISQRAIDNISAVGGGPTGLLSRGVMRFFDDFAYRRIGWRCVLDNGICRMDGIRPSDEGDGYVLVQGWGLPRIDVVGYSRRVSWPVFMSQLRSIGRTGPARIDGS